VSNITDKRADVVVIGDGIIGLSTALELARRGATCRVLGVPNAGIASLAAAGLLAPSIGHLSPDVEPFYHASLAAYPDFVRRLHSEDPELSLIVGLIDTSNGASLDATSGIASAAARLLSETELASLEPTLSAPAGGVLYEREAAIDNVRLHAALRAVALRSPAITADANAPVARVALGGSVATAVTRSGTVYEADRLVLAAGAWSPAITGLPRPLPVEPLKGQMLALGASPLRRSVMSTDVYLVPRGSETLVGATIERAGFDITTDPESLDTLHRAAVRLCPALAAAPVTRSWAGIRPATPDLRPILGADPDEPRLVYACGHSKNGILLAPATADALASLILGEPVAHDLTPFSIERFGANRLANSQ
jgi:glycine oxidase